MSIAVAASCTRRDCRQTAVRMIHVAPVSYAARGNGSNGSNGSNRSNGSNGSNSSNGANRTGPYLLTLRCSVCGHTWAVMRDEPTAESVAAKRELTAERGW